MRVIVLALTLSLAGLVPAGAGGEPAPVRAALVADRVPADRGDVVRVGALLTLEAGWHVYWQNPGDAGLATEVVVEVPAGVEVGPVEWPVPISFTQPGEMIGYGYEGTVLLAREVRFGDRGSFHRAVPLTVRASWLACKDICVLGEARLEGELGGSGVSVDPGAFSARPMSRPTSAARVDVSTTRGAGADAVTVWLRWSQPPGTVEWFPAPVEGRRVDVQRVATRATLTRVDLALRRVGDEPPSSVLPAVVVTVADGVRIGYDLEVEME